MKVLVLKPSSLGDVVHALPFIRLLCRRHPGTRIDWWILPQLAPLLEDDPDVHRAVPFDRKAWGKPGNWRLILSSIRELRSVRYDLAVDLQGLARSSIVGRLAGARRYVGVRDWRELAPLLHGESVARPSPSTHAVDWYLSVAVRLGFGDGDFGEWLPPKARGAAEIAANFPELLSGSWIALQPGARWDTKRWPAERFGELARRLAERHPSHRLAVFGGYDEQALGAAVAAAGGPRCLDLCGRLSLPGMIEAMRLMDLLVTNDTGPMHVAVALGRPVVALFGPTDAARTGPYRRPGEVLVASDAPACAPCFRDRCAYPDPMACLKRIGVAAVADQVARRLG